jgi:hypothetical protein
MIDFTLGDTIRFVVTFKDNSGTAFDPTSTWGKIFDSSSTVVQSITNLVSGTATGIYTYDWQTIVGSHQLGPGAFQGAGRLGSFNYIRRDTLFKLV